jgi:DNA segregation ATPase FtsK/SpoIIIE, S-DNA-T family
MAKRRNKKDPFDYIRLPSLNLDPDIKKGIFIIFVLALGAISLLGLFNLSGALGVYLANALIYLFGWGKWTAPILLLFWGWMLYREEEFPLRGANYLGAILFIISFQSVLYLFLSQNEWPTAVSLGKGGGVIGLFFISIFIKLLGLWASIIVLLGLLLIGLMLLFNTTLKSLVGRESWLAKLLFPFFWVLGKIFKKREDEEEENEDEEEENEEEKKSEEEEGEEEEENKEGEEEEENDEIGFEKRNIKPLRKKPVKKTLDEEDDNVWKKSNIQISLPLDLLNNINDKPMGGDVKNNMLIMQRTLENFGIPVEMGDFLVGPTVTQYTFKPAEGIKLSKITTLSNDLALALAAHPIRIEAPIPGKSLVGVEVPNQKKANVGLKEILTDSTFVNRKSNLMVALGKDVAGKVWVYDLAKMPHLLVAGATNTGKSVCLNSIIISLLYQNNPDDLRIILVDPKKVEFQNFNGIPHLLTPVITDVAKTINALKWCLNEMDRRYDEMQKTGARNIAGHNKLTKNKMPYIVFIIDELADLMLVAPKEVEAGTIRLTQMARAVGIHLILATQRPSVDIITGVIKANMPARIAFTVVSGIDSRTILDSPGAEKLLGRGDMLFTSSDITKPKRLQGALITDDEIQRIVHYIKANGGETTYVDGVTDRQKVKGMAGVGLNNGYGDGGEGELLEEAKELIINSDKASASFLQRRMGIGYARAARILDLLEQAGVIGPSNGAKPREIYVSKEQYEATTNQGVSGVSLHKMDEAEAPDNYLGEDEEEGGENSEDEEDNEDEEEDNDEAKAEDDDDESEQDEDKKEDDDEDQKNKKTKKQENNPKPTFDKFYSR